MINPKKFVDCLSGVGLDFYVGVPDSLLKNFCAFVEDRSEFGQHIITANEGNAVAMASGYHMATGRSAIVYLQNSGLGNTINPLTSIADKQVYGIPMLLIIGWRGEPGTEDEPQHIKQGRITAKQLELLEIPYKIVGEFDLEEEVAAWVRNELDINNSPVALLVKKGAFSSYSNQYCKYEDSNLLREHALNIILELSGDSSIISTTGKTSREVFELRALRGEKQRDFLTVGGMGHTSSIALGAALGNPQKKVVCIDGDGSLLMHMGALPIIGSQQPSNFIHVLLNNAAHESVGGQPTVGDRTDFRAIALASGYKKYALARNEDEITKSWRLLTDQPGPLMLEIRIKTGSRSDLGRPTSSPTENKHAFMEWMAE